MGLRTSKPESTPASGINSSKTLVPKKLVVLGDSTPGVGKTSLISRFTEGTFSPSYFFTIGVDFKIKDIRIDDSNAKMIIWDTTSHDRYRAGALSLYAGVQGAVVGWDVTNRKSFESMHNWMSLWKDNANSQFVQNVVMLGNKCDDEERRVVTFVEGEALAAEYGCAFFETSAKEDINVEEVFMHMATLIVTGHAPCDDIMLK